MGLNYNRNCLINEGAHPKETLSRFLRSPPMGEVKRSASFPTGKLNQISDSQDGSPGTEFREKPLCDFGSTRAGRSFEIRLCEGRLLRERETA